MLDSQYNIPTLRSVCSLRPDAFEGIRLEGVHGAVKFSARGGM